ncbi:MAG TPA: glycosyltransferase [Dehalococcoidia bacterium]|nr:glycosyltransferase [Dehalococcoidia bacterium]
MKLLYRPAVARGLALQAAVAMVCYLSWRLTATINRQAIAFSVLLLCAELQGFGNFLLFILMTWDTKTRPPFALRDGLSVDIFVPTYNEDLELLEATIAGCNAVTYPHTTYLLDDGRRTAVKELALRLGCRYLARPDNRHAKAGNLNHALQHSSGEFIVVLDADTVPQPELLDHTLGYFTDERVALVQLPQEFYNRDSMQHSANGEWHEQELFYRVIQPGKNRWNAAFWCGSPSVVRRAALDDVGGVATETITEDIHTSLRLHARGWKTVYHDELLAYGIAPQTFNAFALQRKRWAQGTMQLLRSRENPLIVPGLTLAQRLNYLASMATYFDAFQKLIYLITPPLILLSGVLPLHASVRAFAGFWVPYFSLGMLANIALGRGYFHYWRVERYNLLKMFTFLQASLTLFWSRPLRFRVTPKRADASVGSLERRQLGPQFALLAFMAIAACAAVFNLAWGLTARYRAPGLIGMTLCWALVNLGMVGLGVREVLSRTHARQNYRFPSSLSARLTDQAGGTLAVIADNLSRSGASLRSRAPVLPASEVLLRLDLPEGPLAMAAEVLRCRPRTDGGHDLGLRFLEISPAEQMRLLRFLFVALPRQERGRQPLTLPPTGQGSLDRGEAAAASA